jgi:hypothetical protein
MYLPWTYPGAETHALPRLPGRLPRRTWPFPPSSSSLPAALPPPPPARPKAPGSPKNPPPPPTLELALDPGRAPRGGCERAGDLGGRVWARGPIRIFRKKNSYGKPGKSTHGRTGGESLPWSYPGARGRGRTPRRTQTNARGRRGERRLPWSRGPTYPTPPRGGKVSRGTTNQTKTHQRTPTRPPEGGCVGEIEAKYGLPSADRNNKATLLLTGPFRTAKSSAKDLTPLVLKLQYAKYRGPLRGPRRNRLLRH